MIHTLKPAGRLVAALALVLTAAASLAVAQPQQDPEVTLKVGNPAPPLAGGEWIKGEPVKQFEPGKTYVVEFWATWCGPCRQTIPHLTQMQKEYEDDNVIFIGQDVWEQDQNAVEPFVKEMGDKMDYRVVKDDMAAGGRGKMAETWLAAAGQPGIPTAFVVDKTGKIAWIGHPLALEPVLKQVVAGTFDPKKAAAADASKEQIGQKFIAAMQAQKWDDALAALDEIEKVDPAAGEQMSAARFNIYLQKKDYDNAYKQAELAGQTFNDNPQALNEIAWTIVESPGMQTRDFDLAQKLAERAAELTNHEEPAVLDTLARAHFEKKDYDKAIEWQEKAVAKADGEMKQELQSTLAKYKAAKK